jgi:ferrochelatase
VLLLNLGTPNSPSVSDVRRYLREFLSDPRVIDIPALPRWLLLNGVILPFRPRTSAKAYQQVWTREGSPLLVHSRGLTHGVAKRLGEGFVVELAMRYGEPSISGAIERLRRAGVERISVLPLFPQYSSAATGSALARVFELLGDEQNIPAVRTLPAFYQDPEFIAAHAGIARPRLDAFHPDFVLFSYHGLPERQVKASDRSGRHCLASDECCAAIGKANADCYRAQCFATTRALTSALGLDADVHSVSFQSRLGRNPWIRPYTDVVLPELADRGIRRLAVMCPAFVADCLETLEEIAIRANKQWKQAGGDELLLVPSLNADAAWVACVARWVRDGSLRVADAAPGAP